MKKNFSDDEKLALLILDQNPKIGAKTLKKIIHRFQSDVAQVLSARSDLVQKCFEPKTAETILEARKEKFKNQIFESHNISPIFYNDPEYPQLLKEIPDFPVILYCRGNKESLNKKMLAIVGSRKHSHYSKSVLEKIIPGLVASDLTIVSGLAIGVDGLAHGITIENSGITVGVLGCGVDTVYPTSNRILGEKIIQTGGAIISEFPPGTPPLKQNFPLRNRIIAGMTLGTLVTEARSDSGSLITAGLAADYNREVFAIPGNIDSSGSQGTNNLIKQGAKMVTEVSDILVELNLDFVSQSEMIIVPESVEEEKIFQVLESGEIKVDKIARTAKLDIVVVNSLLSIAEISGKVERVGGGYRLRGKLKKII